jgi:hypothetical protein
VVGTAAGGLRVRRGSRGAPPAGEFRPAQGRSSGAIRKRRAAGSHLLAGAVGIVAGACLAAHFLGHTPEPSTALYKRASAFTRACETAGAEISTLRRATFFIDECSAPIVTPIFGQEGHVIVSRTVEGHADDDDGERVTYSVKMDGRGIDKWHILEVKRAPNRLTLDASLLATKRSAAPTSAQR